MYSHLEQEGVKGTSYFPCREMDMMVTYNILLVSTKWGPSCHCYLLSWVRWTAFSSSWFSLMQPVNQAFISNAHEGSETASKCGINNSRGMGWDKQWIFAFPSLPFLLLHFSSQVHSFSCSLTWSPHLGNNNEMSATQAIFNVNVIHSLVLNNIWNTSKCALR